MKIIQVLKVFKQFFFRIGEYSFLSLEKLRIKLSVYWNKLFIFRTNDETGK